MAHGLITAESPRFVSERAFSDEFAFNIEELSSHANTEGIPETGIGYSYRG
jgi:hypothetical protein